MKIFTPSGYKTRLEAIDLLHYGAGIGAWSKLYRKELFKDISFPAGYLYEDVGTTYKTVWKASRIYYLDKVLYYHCYRTDSITMLKTEKALNDWLEMYLQHYHDLATWGYPPDKLDKLLNNIALSYCIKKKPNVNDENFIFFKRRLLNNARVPNHFSWKQTVMFVLFKYCEPLFELICVLYDKKIY